MRFTPVSNERGVEHEDCSYFAAWLENDAGKRVAFCNKCGFMESRDETVASDSQDGAT